MSEDVNAEDLKKIDLLLYKILEPDARERLNNVRLVNLDRYLQIANFLINATNTNKINLPIDDLTLKRILIETKESKEFNIVRK